MEDHSPTRIVYDCDTGGALVRDKAVSFSQLHRQYDFRIKKGEWLKKQAEKHGFALNDGEWLVTGSVWYVFRKPTQKR